MNEWWEQLVQVIVCLVWRCLSSFFLPCDSYSRFRVFYVMGSSFTAYFFSSMIHLSCSISKFWRVHLHHSLLGFVVFNFLICSWTMTDGPPALTGDCLVRSARMMNESIMGRSLVRVTVHWAEAEGKQTPITKENMTAGRESWSTEEVGAEGEFYGPTQNS